jgi:hypothetical protein
LALLAIFALECGEGIMGTRAEPRLLWVYATYLLALAAMIEGSWKIVPTMLVGFCIGLGLIFAAFYFVSPYSIQWEEWSIFFGVGCNLAVLTGATWLIRKKHVRGIGTANRAFVLRLCLETAAFLCGGWVGGLSEFFMLYIRAEVVGLLSVALSVAGLWLIIRLVRSPAAEMKEDFEGIESAIMGGVINAN